MEPGSIAQPVSFHNEDASIAIQTGVFNNHGVTTVNLNQTDPLERLPQAAEAPFNASNAYDAHDRHHKRFCLPSTRTALLEEIYSWADAQDEQCVYWLKGLAGTGKSTIARTVALRHKNVGRLGASFFFSKGGRDVGNMEKFVTSIAVQLAAHVPAIGGHIREVARRPCSISKLSLRDQWQDLIIGPLSAVHSPDGISSLVLVIDALDECDDDSDVQTVIELLAEAQALREPRLRVFMTSRPEAAVRHPFGRMSETSKRSFVLHHMPAKLVDTDIELFLKHYLLIVGQQQHLPADWPGPEKIARMVQRAGGLFIWASTAHRFIQEGKSLAAGRLESIMKQASAGPVGPEKHLDNLYLTVLRDSLSPSYTPEEKEEHCKMLRLVLGTLTVLQWPFPMQALSGLLGVAEDSIRRTVQDLHAILDVPEDESQWLRLHHPSLRDFLLDPSRCTDAEFCIDEAQAHAALMSQCDERMSRFVQQNQESDGRIKPTKGTSRLFPAEVIYACQSLTHHQRRAMQLDNNIQVRTLLDDFDAHCETQLFQASLEGDRSGHSFTVFGRLRAKNELMNKVTHYCRYHERKITGS